MFSDTHFHFQNFTENTDTDGVEVLIQMAKNNCFFGLDIGTRSNDLLSRQSCVDNCIAQIKDRNVAEKVRRFIYFSAGIWPAEEEIITRQNSMQILKQQINETACSKDGDTLNRKVIAIGECGIDHHWNPSGVDGRCECNFDQAMFDGERELFEMQLELASKMDLPIIVHSRDGFEDTYDCIKNSKWNKGIIHCYSYGIQESRAFLDLGFYISFSGSVTYTKKSKMEQIKELINFIPNDRLLCETDSPYLAPVPFRGKSNNPVLVEHTYNFIANAKGISQDELCNLVDENIKNLFCLAQKL